VLGKGFISILISLYRRRKRRREGKESSRKVLFHIEMVGLREGASKKEEVYSGKQGGGKKNSSCPAKKTLQEHRNEDRKHI